jgi:NAD(P)-dependent dehydrogenase (short-subunit alcohol dehydrogenase family)
VVPKSTSQKSQCRKQPVSRPNLPTKKFLLIDATGGIGIAIAQGLIEFGATVFLSSSREAKINLEKMQKTFYIRTFATMLTAKIGTRYLKKDRSSSITLTTGPICEKPIAGGRMMLAVIGTATPGLTRQLAFDLAPIRVNCIAPGLGWAKSRQRHI